MNGIPLMAMEGNTMAELFSNIFLAMMVISLATYLMTCGKPKAKAICDFANTLWIICLGVSMTLHYIDRGDSKSMLMVGIILCSFGLAFLFRDVKKRY